MMSLKRPRSTPQKLYKFSQGDDGEVPLLRIHVVSARGLPRSSGAVGMPDPYVVVKFNGDKVGATKPDSKTRRPEWNQNFLIRSDLSDPNADKDSESEEEERYDDHGRGACRSRDPDDDTCPLTAVDVAAASGGTRLGGRVGKEERPWAARPCGSCRACRRRKIEVVLEVWDRHTQKVDEDIQEGSNGHSSSSNLDVNSKPNDLFDDRLFDLSFVSRCFQRGALRRVHGAVVGGNKLIGVCRISSAQLRALGSSTLPADLAIRDPRGSWWSFSRGTIRVAVSLERLQANIIRATLSPSKATQAAPPGTTGVWSAVAGVSREGHQDGEGGDAFQPAEFFCKVLWNGQDFSSPSQWDKIFCFTQRNDQLWLDIRASPDQPGAPSSGNSETSVPLSRSPTGVEHDTHGGQQVQEDSEEASPSPPDAAAAAVVISTKANALTVASITMAPVTTVAYTNTAAMASTAAAAIATTSTKADDQWGENRRQYQWHLTRRRRARRRQQPHDAGESEECVGDRSCVLKLGKLFHLSTFDAQGLADMLNSVEEWTQRMAGTKEWHEKGFRVHWDGFRRRFTILNVSKRSFVLRGSSSSLATELLGFEGRDYASQPVAEALLDPQQPSDPPRRHMAVTADSIPPPLLRPHWMRIVWGPPAMEIARGGELRVQIWARQPVEYSSRLLFFRRRRRRSSLGVVAAAAGQSEDGSWLVGTALLDAAEVCRVATGNPTWLPLFSPRTIVERHRNSITNGSSASGAASAAAIAGTEQKPVVATAAASSSPGLDGVGLSWAARAASILARQRQRLRRLKRRIVSASLGSEKCTPVGVGGAEVRWGQTRSRLTRPGRGSDSGLALTPAVRGNGKRGAVNGPPSGVVGRRVSVGGAAAVTPGGGGDGVVGHVWMSLKLRDPSMLVMRAVRQWNIARDEASLQQRRDAQVEAKRLWMFMPGISLWRVLVQLAGVSLLVSYCVTLTLRAYHSTSCRATFNCKEETDPTLASLREWQTLADNLLSAISFLDMLLQFRTAYVDSNSKIITDPKKVAVHYLRTWFVPDLWCSLPYGTMQPLLQPLLDELEDAADSLSQTSIAQQKAATEALSRSILTGADSPLSLFVYRLSKRLHIPKINRIRGTRAFKYVDDATMGIDLTVKQIAHVLRGRRKLLDWLGNAPKRRGRIRKFFFRVGVTNKWTRIVLSYRLLGYAKVIGTLLRAMRVFAVAIRAVPRAARVLRLLAVCVRSYEGRRRWKDLHEASIVIQRRAGRHLALKVAGRFQANLRRRARASSESALTGISPNDNSDAAPTAALDVRCGSPVQGVNGPSMPTPPQSSIENDGCVGEGSTASRARRASESDASEHRSECWSDCG